MRNMLVIRSALPIALTLLAGGASAKDTPGQQFIVKAVQGNLAEVALGQLDVWSRQLVVRICGEQ